MILVENLVKTYTRGREKVKALDGLNLKVEEGELVGILGPSGSGKSTLMNILGLLEQPSGGKLELKGRPVVGLREEERARMRQQIIGFVFQQFLLVPSMTALKNVMLPMYFAGRDKAHQKAVHLLARVGLQDRMEHLPSQLSGGEAQRVAVARALANSPSILLADEPTGNLDSRTSREIFQLLEEVNSEGTTVLVVTHNSELANQLPRILEIRDGKVEKDVRKNNYVH